MIANQNVFSDVEFTKSAYLEELKLEEKFLIEKYLSKEGKTIEAGTGGGRILIENHLTECSTWFVRNEFSQK